MIPGWILQDRLAADLVESDGLGAFPRGGRHREHPADQLGEFDAEKRRGHAAHRAADDRVELHDAEVFEQQLLRMHHVADGHKGEVGPVGPAAGRVDRGGPGRALAAAEHIGANDVETAGVDGLARADQVVPPTGLAVGGRVPARAMMIAAQGVADQDRVIPCDVEGPVGFIPQGEAGQDLPVLERKRMVVGEIPRLHETHLAGRQMARRGVRCGLFLDIVRHGNRD